MQTLGSMLYNSLGSTLAQISSRVIYPCFFLVFVLEERCKLCNVGGLFFPREGRPVQWVL